MPFRPYITLVGGFAKYIAKVHSSSCHVTGLEQFLQLLADQTRRDGGRGVLTYANHISVMDDPAIWGCMPVRTFQDSASTRWTLGASDILFTNALTSSLFSNGQVIPTDRGRGIFQPALDTAIEKLNGGQWVHLFPEGYVNLSRKMILRRFKWGLSRLLLESRRRPRVVPIWIEGFDQLMPDPRGFPRFVPRPFANLRITFGDPIDHADSPLDTLLSDLRNRPSLNPSWWQEEKEEMAWVKQSLPPDGRAESDAPAIPVPSPSSFPTVAAHVTNWSDPPSDSPAYRSLMANEKDGANAMAARSWLAELLRRELAALGVKASRARGAIEGRVGQLAHTLMPEEDKDEGVAAPRHLPASPSAPGSQPQRRQYSTSTTGPSDSKIPSATVPDAYNCFTSRASLSAGSSSSATFEASSSLSGWTVSIKDNICTRDMPTTASSLMLKDYTSSFDATVVSILKSSSATIVGKTNCDQFGMGSGNIHSSFGPVVNPAMGGRESYEERRSAGGSSGGAAASVKAGYCRIAIGSDTGGSIRLPAAYCGVWGLKPSYGLVSRWGLISYADSLDTIGIIANDWSDCETALEVLSVPDTKDPTSVNSQVRSAAVRMAKEALTNVSQSKDCLRGLRIGIPTTFFASSLNGQILPSFSRLLRHLEEDLGATIVRVEVPSAFMALSAYYVIASAEASSNLARYDGIRYGHRSTEVGLGKQEHPYAATRSSGFGEEVRKRILLGTHALSADAFDNTFLAAQLMRQTLKAEFDEVFRIPNVLLQQNGSAIEGRPSPDRPSRPSSGSNSSGVDVLLHPSAVNTAPLLSSLLPSSTTSSSTSSSSPAHTESQSGMEEYVQDLLTVPASLAGLPSVSMPLGKGEEDGWPLGVMATSQWGMERVLGRLATALKGYTI